MLIFVDRFIAIVLPLKAIKITARVRKSLLLLLSWPFPVLGAIPYFKHFKIVLEERQTFCRNLIKNLLLKAYYFISFILFYFSPLIVIKHLTGIYDPTTHFVLNNELMFP